MAIVVLDMVVTFFGERVLAETENAHHPVIELLGMRQIGDSEVDVIDSNYFDVHSREGLEFKSYIRQIGFKLS